MQPRCLVSRSVPFMVAVLLALAPAPAAAQAEPQAPFVPVTDAMLEDPAPGDWLSWRRTPDGWGF